MNFRFNTVQEEDEWEIITADWWRTAFILVPWTYTPDATEGKSLRQQFRGSLFAGLSSHRDIYSDDVQYKLSSEGDTLNPELVGVSGAMAAVASYEEDVGFSYSTCPTIEPHELNLYTPGDLSINIDEIDLLTGRQRWKDLVEDLMNGEIYESTNGGSPESSLIGSFSSAGELTLSSMDLSSSDGSIDSFVMPSTPKAKHFLTDVEVKASSPNGSIDGSGFENPTFLSPGKSLNAAASSFEAIPFPPLVDASKSFSPTLPFANFTFPTLNAPSQPKDDQGFFTEVQNEPPNAGQPTILLPSFLQESSHRHRPRKSRTREISSPDDSTAVHFSLSNGIELPPKYASHSPSPIRDDRSFIMPRLSVSEDGGDRASGLSTPSLEDDDGWISQPNALSPRHKAKRTRELFLALTRPLMDSADDSSALHPRNTSAPPSPSPQTPPPLTNPTPPEPQKKSKPTSRESHRRKKSHNIPSRASLPTSATSSHFPISPTSAFSPHITPQAIPYFFPAYPAIATPVPYAAFMHFPTFPIGMPMHGHAGLPLNSTSTPYGTNPALITRRAVSMKGPMSSPGMITNMNMMPTYTAKQSPLW
ncbi:hypothetical protein BYT27DRAFT_7233987 [Phlegmacium glaucopus]|nr:hypothetical protein BYT27DRAFT_7233987 [Phlegmacium glaucopus]